MKPGWQTKRLGEICEIELGRTPPRANEAFWDEERETSNVWLSIADLLNAEENLALDSKEYLSDKGAAMSKIVHKGTLLVSFKLTLGRLAFAGRDLYTNEAIAALKLFNERELSKEFLFYFLHFFDWRKAAENDVKIKGMTLNKGKLKELQVHFPPLPEQKRIVGFLDEAFDGIATAKANAEKNLHNARALFESHLESVFSHRGDGWVRTTIGNQLTLQRGFDITKDEQKEGDVPVVSSGGIKSFHNKAMVKAPGVVIGRKGTLGKVFYLESDFWPHDTTLWVKEFKGNNPRFVYYFLGGLDVKRLDSGTANPALNRNQVHPIEIEWPPVSQQKALVSTLDSLSEETLRLDSIYQQKLAALEELKQSLLAKTFSSELRTEAPSLPAFRFPVTIPNITTTDLHAGLIAIAYQSHEQENRQDTLGHVKAEKIAHMVEAHLGIDLGRTPIKDAAGPNDYPHLKKVEHRSEKAGFFTFQGSKRAGYKIARGRNFDGLILRTRLALGVRNQEVDQLIELMTPMDSEQAEIFSTVYSAWNNLLLDRQLVTDAGIVVEARDNWHPEKLRISREKFFRAVTWMKAKGITPQGRGRKVTNKG